MEHLPRLILPKLSQFENITDTPYVSIEPKGQSRRKHQSVLVACNRCRFRKIGCNGARPTCKNCGRRKIKCEYISTSADQTPAMAAAEQLRLLRERLKDHEEVLDHLQTVPEHEALATIRRLRSTGNVRDTLALISGRTGNTVRPSDIDTARAIGPPTGSRFEFELNVQHALVYPPLEPLDLGSSVLEKLLARLPQQHGLTPKPLNPSNSTGSGRQITVTPGVVHPDVLHTASPLTDEVPGYQYVDFRLTHLDVGYWTQLPIDNDFAARILSHYLESDHPVWGCFDADLFLSDLVDHKLNACSPFLFHALMAHACTSYSIFHRRSAYFADAFLRVAQALWRANTASQRPLDLSAMCYMLLAANVSGREDLRAPLTKDFHDLGIKLRLFGVRPTEDLVLEMQKLPRSEILQRAHIAWGIYGWLTISTGWFDCEPIAFPPVLPIPGDINREGFGPSSVTWPVHNLPSYMGQTFPTLCRFWVILQDINALFLVGGGACAVVDTPFAAAECKYQELLAWAKRLSPQMARGEYNPSHVFFFHGLFHSTVLTIFRPFTESALGTRLSSFSSMDSTSSAVCAASMRQIERLLYNYLAQTPPIPVCWSFNGAIIQVSQSLLKNPQRHSSWKFYFGLCFQYWKEAYVSYRVFLPIFQGTLAVALESGAISSKEAKTLMEDFLTSGRHYDAPEECNTTAFLDLELALSNPREAKIDVISSKLEEILAFQDLMHDDLTEFDSA